MRTVLALLFLASLPLCGAARADRNAPPDTAPQQVARPDPTPDDPADPAQPEKLSPYEWKKAQKAAFETSERIYADALERNGLLAQYKAMRDAYRADRNQAFRVVFGQYLSWYQTYVGDYVGAHDAYSIRQLPASDDARSPFSGNWQVRPAIDAIAELARGRKAVFFNEAHNVPLTRTLTLQLLERLRKEGFTHFAAETLYATDTGLARRGYPTRDSGFYTEEPIYAEMIRTALALGYTVVAYESEEEGNGDVREHAQARNLQERVFRRDPDARLVVNAGYAHIQETGRYLGGRSMAQHFRKQTGIDPLTIEQTMLIEHPPGTENHPYYHAVVDKLRPQAPIAFVSGREAWSLKPHAYDVSVFFPVEVVRNGRPTWADLGGLRSSQSIGGDFCRDRFPCLIEARYADEGDDAIPADRLVLDPLKGATSDDDRVRYNAADVRGDLYLRPGRYRLVSLDADNRVISHRDLRVRGSGRLRKPEIGP